MNISVHKEFLNVDGSYTGKGVKIAVVENRWSKQAYVEFEIPTGVDSFPGGEDSVQPHNYATLWTVKQVAPDAEIYLIPPTIQGFAWAYSNDIDIVTMSLSKSMTSEYMESKLYEKSFMLCAAGNEGDSEDELKRLESVASQSGYYCPVGAVDYNHGSPQIRKFSAYGSGKVKVCGFDGNVVPYYGEFLGTSAATPFAAGILACFSEWFKERFHTKPSINQFNKYIEKASIDLMVPGYDLKTGFGLLMQKFDESLFNVSMISIGSTIGMNNGKHFELVVAPKIVDSKAQVELTVLRKNGAAVGWDDGNIYIVT